MLKKLFAVAATVMLAGPAAAVNPEGVRYYSLDSLGCIMLRECTEGVDKVTSVDEVIENLGPGYDTHKDELNELFAQLNKLEIDVFLTEDRYFPPNHRGIYDVKSNTFFLNKSFVWDEGHLVGVMRHEGWHAAQDCMAGTLDNTFTAVILQDGTVPQFYMDTVDRLYPPKPRPWEYEAFFAAAREGMTAEALAACAADNPMWEAYAPTPMTREWLVQQGYITN